MLMCIHSKSFALVNWLKDINCVLTWINITVEYFIEQIVRWIESWHEFIGIYLLPAESNNCDVITHRESNIIWICASLCSEAEVVQSKCIDDY